VVIDPLYFVLGFLNEYDGRHVTPENADFIEFLYSEEEHMVEFFQGWLEKLAQQKGLVTPIEIERNEGGWTIFRSRQLAALINGCYKDARSGLFEGSLDMFASHHLFEEKGRIEELSFLAGAHARFGAEGILRIANAQHKVDLIARLLGQFGCQKMAVTYYPGYVPRVFVLSFEASKEISDWLVHVSLSAATEARKKKQ
jgi:hypothetical protein